VRRAGSGPSAAARASLEVFRMSRSAVRRVLLAIALASAACRPEAPAAGTSGGGTRLLVGVVPKGTAQEYWKGVHAGALRAAKELGVDILWEGPLREDDREEQIKVLDTDEYVSLIETDNYKGGRMAGDHLAKLLGEKGPVMMLRLQVGSASTTQREQGFLDAVASYKGMTVVSSNQYGSTVSDVAYRAAENLVAAQRVAQGAVAGIFTPNETTTFAMLRALQNAGLAGRVRLVGFDSSDKVLQGLRDGQVDALVLQNPVAMGYQGVKTIVQHLKGVRVPRNIDTGVALVTKDNMDARELQERLHPGRAPELK
jgi:ribose transport system substrate-binding protein